jgi:hypothetical protein
LAAHFFSTFSLRNVIISTYFSLLPQAHHHLMFFRPSHNPKHCTLSVDAGSMPSSSVDEFSQQLV